MIGKENGEEEPLRREREAHEYLERLRREREERDLK
jgi:hypothetical protein